MRERDTKHSGLAYGAAGMSLAIMVIMGGCASAEPVRLSKIDIPTADGAIRGYAATVNLRDPRVRLVGTSALAADSGKPAGAEARLVPTDEWARSVDATLAINANYFGRVAGGAGAWKAGEYVDVLGLSIADGVVVSPVREYAGRPDPALAVFADGRAVAGYLRASDVVGAQVGVASIGPSDTDPARGTMLVDDAVNLGGAARVEPSARHPRTAVGVSRDGSMLIIVAIDGRSPGHSIGATLNETGDILIGLGAFDAINLDGGGSTSFVYVPTDGPSVQNRPSDGAFRPVANHLGVRIMPRAQRSPSS